MSANGRAQEHRTKTLLRGLQSSGLCVIYNDADLAVRLVENPPPSWPTEAEIVARGFAAVFDPFTAERVRAAKREVLDTGVAQRLEVPFRPNGGDLLWYELNLEPDHAAEGPARGMFISVVDITTAMRREAALRDLLFEVSHRSRNMLAILQSILGQTAGRSASVGEFEQKFRGRIASIAQSQDLITYANWQSVRFKRLVETQIAAFGDQSRVEPRVAGEDPLLSPNAALHLGLAMHELSANSSAFGVLAADAGDIRIVAAPLGAGYRLEWIETPVKPFDLPDPISWGFGRTILAHVAPRALRAEAVYSVEPQGVHYALDLHEDVAHDPGLSTRPYGA